jgi:hypothetical protein
MNGHPVGSYAHKSNETKGSDSFLRVIHPEFDSVYHKAVFVLSIVYKWRIRFGDGRAQLSNYPRSCRPRRSGFAETI